MGAVRKKYTGMSTRLDRVNSKFAAFCEYCGVSLFEGDEAVAFKAAVFCGKDCLLLHIGAEHVCIGEQANIFVDY